MNDKIIISKIYMPRRKYTKRRNTKRRNSKRRNTKRRNTKRRNTNRRKSTNHINSKRLMKILNLKQMGGAGTRHMLGEGEFASVSREGETLTVKKIFKEDVEWGEVEREFFFGTIVKALAVNNNDLQKRLDADNNLEDNIVVLYTESGTCERIALYTAGVEPNTHSVKIFNVNTNPRGGCNGYRQVGESNLKLFLYGGFKLFDEESFPVPNDAIRLPPRVMDKDYSSVKVPTYHKIENKQIIIDYVEGKTLRDYFVYHCVLISEDRKLVKINESILRPIFKQVLEFISMINNNYLSHNDLNFDNIIVDDNDPDNVSVTVIDYGIMSITGYGVLDEGYWRHVPHDPPPNCVFNGPLHTFNSKFHPLFFYNNTDTYIFFCNVEEIIEEIRVSVAEADGAEASDLGVETAECEVARSQNFKEFMTLVLTYDGEVKEEPYGSTPADVLLDHTWISQGEPVTAQAEPAAREVERVTRETQATESRSPNPRSKSGAASVDPSRDSEEIARLKKEIARLEAEIEHDKAKGVEGGVVGTEGGVSKEKGSGHSDSPSYFIFKKPPIWQRAYFVGVIGDLTPGKLYTLYENDGETFEPFDEYEYVLTENLISLINPRGYDTLDKAVNALGAK